MLSGVVRFEVLARSANRGFRRFASALRPSRRSAFTPPDGVKAIGIGVNHDFILNIVVAYAFRHPDLLEFTGRHGTTVWFEANLLVG
jgi:hypothetical protein